MNLTRRETLSLAAVAALAGAVGLPLPALAKEGDVVDQLKLMAPAGIPDKVIGNPDAKVTLIEYASPTCPHCAIFSNTVLQSFIDKYVTPGKVKFILRPFARNTMDAAIFMLAEAAAKSTDAPTNAASTDASAASSAPAAGGTSTAFSAAAVQNFDSVIGTFFRTQASWGVADKPLDAVKSVAMQLGFNDDSFKAALTNQDYFNAIQAMRDQAVKDFGLEGTPTFYVNGKQLTGEKTLDDLSKEIDPLL